MSSWGSGTAVLGRVHRVLGADRTTMLYPAGHTALTPGTLLQRAYP
jgi:hypothetical protein